MFTFIMLIVHTLLHYSVEQFICCSVCSLISFVEFQAFESLLCAPDAISQLSFKLMLTNQGKCLMVSYNNYVLP